MLEDFFEKNEEKIKKDYFSFLRFASIATDPKHEKDTKDCASWLSDYIKDMGFESSLIQTPSFPLVYGHYFVSDKLPTLLIYGHYDVQPVDPLEEWDSKPFEPTEKEGKIYARGAVDNKGQIFYTLNAIRALLDSGKPLGVNIKICIEGEEESGSSGLSSVMQDIKDKIKADYILAPDFGLTGHDKPAITLGARGVVMLEVLFRGSNIDLHSGQLGGIAYNPLRALVTLLAKLWDEKGQIQVPGFYEDVISLTEEELEELDTSFDPIMFEKTFGIKALGGEKDYSPIEANWLRPTLEINGIGGGYFGHGFKTVIPSKAIAKISCRLVPHQDPEKIGLLISEFLHKYNKEGIDIEVNVEKGGFAIRGKGDSLLAKAISKGFEEVFNTPCLKILAGGSVPVLSELVSALNCPVIMMGLGLPSDAVHAPNEHFEWDRFKKGFLVIAKSIQKLGEK